MWMSARDFSLSSSGADLHNAVHLVIYYMTCLPEVNGVYDFVVAIVFVSVQIRSLPAMTGIVEEERVIRSRVFHQPVHCSEYILLRRLAHRILLIVCQDDHVFSLVAEMTVQICRHVLDVVDTSSQLASLPEVVDAYEKCFSSTCAVGILESVARGSAMSKILCLLRWWWRPSVCYVRYISIAQP